MSTRPVRRNLVSQRMTEKELKSIVLTMAHRAGWMYHHDLPAVNSRGRWMTHFEGMGGFPDVLLLHPNHAQLMVLELKTDKGRTTTRQDNWLAAFGLAGVENHVIRPSDLEFITHRLTRPDLYGNPT